MVIFHQPCTFNLLLSVNVFERHNLHINIHNLSLFISDEIVVNTFIRHYSMLVTQEK